MHAMPLCIPICITNYNPWGPHFTSLYPHLPITTSWLIIVFYSRFSAHSVESLPVYLLYDHDVCTFSPGKSHTMRRIYLIWFVGFLSLYVLQIVPILFRHFWSLFCLWCVLCVLSQRACNPIVRSDIEFCDSIGWCCTNCTKLHSLFVRVWEFR